MKILQLCHKVPFPPKDGGSIAMHNLTEGLINEGYNVKVMAINTSKHFTDIYQLPSDYLGKTNIEAIFIDTKVKLIPAFLNLFTGKSYNIERFYSKAFEHKLIELLKIEHFDIIQLESIYVSMYVDAIRKHSKAKIVLRAHNIEHQIWEQRVVLTKNPLRKFYLNLLAKRLKEYELTILKSIDAIAAITKDDENYFRKYDFKAVETFPFGIDLKYHSLGKPDLEEYISIFHIGSMDWSPNMDGVSWFLKYVWPDIHARYPGVKLYLAGKNMPAWLKQLNMQSVVIVGEVADAFAFIQSKAIMIVPLLSGGGMRVKIIEGMALGKTIVSTTIGAEGINYTANKNILIADTPGEFFEHISNCILDKTYYEEIGMNATKLAMQEYNNSDICKRLTTFYHQLVAGNN
ncbi:MAG: glycosyltransferase [Bacteroidetes bacterium]|nr:glycosyltransferase [Bacteroidota bacterium]